MQVLLLFSAAMAGSLSEGCARPMLSLVMTGPLEALLSAANQLAPPKNI
jgi:hypothetical protein